MTTTFDQRQKSAVGVPTLTDSSPSPAPATLHTEQPHQTSAYEQDRACGQLLVGCMKIVEQSRIARVCTRMPGAEERPYHHYLIGGYQTADGSQYALRIGEVVDVYTFSGQALSNERLVIADPGAVKSVQDTVEARYEQHRNTLKFNPSALLRGDFTALDQAGFKCLFVGTISSDKTIALIISKEFGTSAYIKSGLAEVFIDAHPDGMLRFVRSYVHIGISEAGRPTLEHLVTETTSGFVGSLFLEVQSDARVKATWKFSVTKDNEIVHGTAA